MKINKLICHNCGNTEKFRVDVRLEMVSAELTFDDEAELDIAFPDDVEIMCPVCAVCGADLNFANVPLDAPCSLCVACREYTDGDLVEVCPHKAIHPTCFNPKEIELNLVA